MVARETWRRFIPRGGGRGGLTGHVQSAREVDPFAVTMLIGSGQAMQEAEPAASWASERIRGRETAPTGDAREERAEGLRHLEGPRGTFLECCHPRTSGIGPGWSVEACPLETPKERPQSVVAG